MNMDGFMDLMATQIRANASDKNVDSLSAQTIQFLLDSFRMFDQDKDGYLNEAEIKNALGMIGESEDLATSLLSDADMNHDSKIDLDEWIEMMKDIDC